MQNVARLYNLEEDDDEEEESIQVTHKGRLLSEIEKFDDLEKDDEDEEDEKMFSKCTNKLIFYDN